MAKCGIADVSVLALDRFRLRDEIEARIQQHRDGERKVAFQAFLLPEAPLAVSEERTINFKTMSYEPSWLYEGGFQFKKHYFGAKPGELKETTPSGKLTEEFKCAQFLDGLPEVGILGPQSFAQEHVIPPANLHGLVLPRFPLPAHGWPHHGRRIQRQTPLRRR